MYNSDVLYFKSNYHLFLAKYSHSNHFLRRSCISCQFTHVVMGVILDLCYFKCIRVFFIGV